MPESAIWKHAVQPSDVRGDYLSHDHTGLAWRGENNDEQRNSQLRKDTDVRDLLLR